MPKSLNRLLKEPLTQFILGGFILFLMVEFFTPSQAVSNNPHDISVDEAALLNYIQFRSKAFNIEAARQYLQTLTIEDRAQLIDDFVRDEVLYRAALSLALDENDEVIRRRLIQKLEYISQGFVDNGADISEVDLRSKRFCWKDFSHRRTLDRGRHFYLLDILCSIFCKRCI